MGSGPRNTCFSAWGPKHPDEARLLAARLEMKMLAVQMPGGARTPIIQPCSFDAVHVREPRVAWLSFFLEDRYAGKIPLTVCWERAGCRKRIRRIWKK